MLIMVILSAISASALYAQAKKAGVSPVKWALIGIMAVVVPLVLLPNVIVYISGRADLDGPAIMFAVVTAICLNAILTKRIQPAP